MTQSNGAKEGEVQQQVLVQMHSAYADFQRHMDYLHKQNVAMEREIKQRMDQQRISQIHNALKQLP